jgi:hypothetical protein
MLFPHGSAILVGKEKYSPLCVIIEWKKIFMYVVLRLISTFKSNNALQQLNTLCAPRKYPLYLHLIIQINQYECVSKILRTGAAIYTAVVVTRSTGKW